VDKDHQFEWGFCGDAVKCVIFFQAVRCVMAICLVMFLLIYVFVCFVVLFGSWLGDHRYNGSFSFMFILHTGSKLVERNSAETKAL
jgi:hypothetical protein